MGEKSETEVAELLQRYKGGDESALNALVERLRAPLLDRIRTMMGNEARRRAESGDFLNEALLEVIKDVNRYDLRTERDFLRWATRVARNNIRDHVRARRERLMDSFTRNSGILEGLPRESEGTPSRDVLRAEQFDLVIDALMNLQPEYREAIEMRWFEELSFAEAGRRTGRSEAAARQFHSRALIRLGIELDRNANG